MGSSEMFIDPTQQWVDQQNAGSRDLNRERSGAWWDTLTGALNPGGYSAAMNNYLNQATGAFNDMQSYANAFDPSAGFNAFMQQSPQLQQQALDFSRQAYGLADTRAQNLANQASARAIANLSSQLAGSGALGSGAGIAAIAQAAAEPQVAMMAQLAQSQGDLAGGLFNSMGNQAMGLSNQNYLQQVANQMQAAGARGEGALQGAGMQGNMAQTMAGLMGQAGEQQLLAPTFMENPNYWSNKDIINTIIGGLGTAGSVISGIPGGWGAIGKFLGGLGGSPQPSVNPVVGAINANPGLDAFRSSPYGYLAPGGWSGSPSGNPDYFSEFTGGGFPAGAASYYGSGMSRPYRGY